MTCSLSEASSMNISSSHQELLQVALQQMHLERNGNTKGSVGDHEVIDELGVAGVQILAEASLNHKIELEKSRHEWGRLGYSFLIKFMIHKLGQIIRKLQQFLCHVSFEGC